MSKEQVSYWIEIADYDLDTAKAMYSTKRWLYVGFMCHQVVEKIMKAYWCATKPDDPPYTHNLLSLYQSTNLVKLMSEDQVDFITEIVPLNIEARYPSYKQQLAMGLTPEYCKNLLAQTEAFVLWIKQQF